MNRWSEPERADDLRRAERDGVDVLVIGGGITGAGALRDAASRGLRGLLVDSADFASGTSSRSSKLIHGGLRYIGEGQLAMTREACRERDRLVRQNPQLVRSVPFLLPAYEDGGLPLWQVRAVLWIYRALANFRSSSRFRMLSPERVAEICPDLRRDGLRGAGLYHDGQVDDARLVIETLKSARSLGGGAVNHAAVGELLRGGDGAIVGARVHDAIGGRAALIRAAVVVNATGAAVSRVQSMAGADDAVQLRPAKGIHLVIARDRVRLPGAVSFQAPDGRHLFLAPWEDVALLGTTDRFSDEIDEPVVTIDEVHYLLDAANRAFPGLGLTTNDLRSVFAGVRPLPAEADEEVPSTSVSREHRIDEEPGLISVVGGKLTTFRAMGEQIVDRALAQLPDERRRAAGPCRTADLPLRRDDFDPRVLEAQLARQYGIGARRAESLVRTWGAEAETLLAEAPPAWHGAIGDSRFTWAEIAWSFAHECPTSLCDLLERRLRLVIFAVGQGLRELPEIAAVAASATGWDPERTRDECTAYADRVRRCYQIVSADRQQTAA